MPEDTMENLFLRAVCIEVKQLQKVIIISQMSPSVEYVPQILVQRYDRSGTCSFIW